MRPLVLYFPEDERVAREIIALTGAEEGVLTWHRFPDRESLMTLRGDCTQRDVIVICTLSDPDSKALPLYFCSATAREQGARRVGLIAPYLGYMRQDQRFQEGQTRSAHEFGKFLSSSFDWLATVDPHLHRLRRLSDVFSIPAVAISAMPAVSDWIRTHVPNPVLIGPDRESAQWVERVARLLGAPCVVLDKVRSGDRTVAVGSVDPAILLGRKPVIIDDIASSGRTLAEVLGDMQSLGIVDVTCVIVHALFSEGAEGAIRSAGAGQLISTDTVLHTTNRISVAPLIAEALGPILAGRTEGNP